MFSSVSPASADNKNRDKNFSSLLLSWLEFMVRVCPRVSCLGLHFHYLPLSSHPFSVSHQLITPCVFKSACSFHHGCWLLCLDFGLYGLLLQALFNKAHFFIPVPVRLCVLRLAPFVFNLNTYLSCQLEHFMHHLQNIKISYSSPSRFQDNFRRPILNELLNQTSWMILWQSSTCSTHSTVEKWELEKWMEVKTAMMHMYFVYVCVNIWQLYI